MYIRKFVLLYIFLINVIFCFRVNDYIKNGMDKDVVDLDGGVNLVKKRKLLGVVEVVDFEINENFFFSGF